MGLESIVEKDPYAAAKDVTELLDIAIKENGYKSRSAYLREKGKEKGFNADSAKHWFTKINMPLDKLLFFGNDLSIPKFEFERFGYNLDNLYSHASTITELLDLAIKSNNYKHRWDYLKIKGKEYTFNPNTANRWFARQDIPIEKLILFADDLSIPKSEFERFGYDLDNPYSHASNITELLDLAIQLNGYRHRSDYLKRKEKEHSFNLDSVNKCFARQDIPIEKLILFTDDLSIPKSEFERFGYDLDNPYSHASTITELLDLAIKLNGYNRRSKYLNNKGTECGFNSRTVASWFYNENMPLDQLLFFGNDLSIPKSEFERFGYNLDNLYSHASTITELLDLAIKSNNYKHRWDYLKIKGKEYTFNPNTANMLFARQDIPIEKLILFADDLSIPKSEFERFGYDLDNPYSHASTFTELLDLAIKLNGYNNRWDYLKKKGEEYAFNPITANRWIRKEDMPLDKLILFADDLSIPISEFECFGYNLESIYANVTNIAEALKTAIALKGDSIVGYLGSKIRLAPLASVKVGQKYFTRNNFPEPVLEFLINDLDLPDTVFGDSEWSVYESIMHYKDSLGDESWDVKTYFETFEGKPLYQYVIQFYKSEPVKNQVGFEDFLYSQVPEEHKEEAWYVLSGQYKEDLMMNKLSELAEDNELKNKIGQMLGE